MKNLFTRFIAFSMILLSYASIAQTTHTVEAGMFYYEPQNLTIEVGDIVSWNNLAGTHDVNFDVNSITGQSFGNPDNTSLAANSGGDLGSITFTEPGTYTYDCSIGSHASNGMVGTITVAAAPSNVSGIVFSGVFGGSVADGNTYTVPSGSDSWAGFANEDASVYPFTFGEGGSITFSASAASPAEIYFKFEKNPYPDTEPSFPSETISLSTETANYTVEIPSQGGNTFSSFLLYVSSNDVAVTLNNLVVNTSDYSGSVDVVGCMDSNASNFNADATAAGQDQYGNSVCVYASCDDIPTWGCIYVDGFGAFNEGFDAAACSSYGGTPCEEPISDLAACTDQDACNYNSAATSDDGSCNYPSPGYNCDFEFIGCPDGTDNYALNAYDSGNDGWGNSLMYAYFDGVLQVDDQISSMFGVDYTYKLALQFSQGCMPDIFNGGAYENCATHTLQFCVDQSVECMQFVVTTDDMTSINSSDPSEVSWEFLNPDGDIVSSGGAGSSTSVGPCDPIEPQFTFSGTFGGSSFTGTEYMIPSGSESWAGFANLDLSIYPLIFEDGGSITFNASSSEETAIYFKFEYNPHPDTEPSFNTDTISLNNEESSYTVNIPSQGDNTYSSFLMYIVDQDVSVSISDLELTTSGTINPSTDISGCIDENASNYDANATLAGQDQYGNSVCVYASCDDIPEYGCIYADGFGAFNESFDAVVCESYGGTPCSEPTGDITGCMDMNASNYNAAATIAGEDEYGNSTCIYASCDDIPEYGCIYADGFGAFNDEFNAAQCSGYGGTPCSEPTDDIAGCMDMNATNYDANATVAGEDQYGNSTCIYASCDDIPTWGCIYVDGFGTFNPEFGDDLCVTYGGTPCVEPTDEIEGCMDENATNYNATATVSDYDQYGNLKCVYASCDDIPEYGCIYADGFGAFNAEFGAEACSSYGGTPCSEPTDALLGCMDANASNYDATATEQSFDQYGNLNCLFESCDAIPQPGCIYPNGFGLFNAEFGPEECTTYGGNPCGEYQSVRYQDEIFTEVTVTENVQYGANIGIITQAPVLENLMMDVYEPTGDTETDRPVVVMLHTGSFLPAIANGQPTGDKSDFAIVEACKNYARRGYVAVAVNYRLGWNPVSTSEDVRRSTLIQAAYRGLQDTKTAVRFLRKSAAEDGNPYGVGEKFAVGGYGTGGYLSLAMATLNDYDSELLMPKFIDSSQETIDEFGQPMPYIIPSVLGNFEATDNAVICVANHVGYSSEVDMVFNAGGALPDISWLDAGEVPIASMQNILDPDAPYAEGNVIVPTTGEFVIVAHGSQIVQETANAYGNNDVFDGMSTTLNDAWYGNGNGAENAAAAGHDDLPGLFGMVTPAPSAAPTVCGMQTVQNAPWDAWNNAMYDAMASVYQGQPAGVMGCLATLGNPDMSEEKALAMLDMMDEFFAPRIDAALSTPSSDVDNEGPTSQTIELPNGWSMFSTYMTASDMAFDAVVSSIVDNVTIAKDFNGSAYLPEYSFNGIGNMELGQGYQIKTDEAVTLTVGGSYNAPEANPIALVQGWNMIGYLRLQPADASLVLADLTAQSIIEIAKDYNGSAFLPEYSFNGIGDFEAGRGYQVKTTEAATLTLNANGSDYNRTVALKTTFNKTNHFEQAVNTGSNMTITILNDAWEVSPTIGDEIAAYNANGILVGSAKYTSPVTVLTVWGNDATTNTVDGLVNAEGMRFKVWNKRYNSTDELVVTNWIEGSNAYEVNAVNQIGQIGYVSNSVNSSTFGLYPVPANKELNLDLTLDLSQDVTVTLYNLIGKVMNVATYSLEKGLNTVLLDVETLKDGTYLCKVLTNNGEITRKFNVIK